MFKAISLNHNNRWRLFLWRKRCHR